MEFAKCLKCGCKIEIEDTIEESVNSEGSSIIATHIGTCPKCGQRYMWDEVFQYLYFKSLYAMKN